MTDKEKISEVIARNLSGFSPSTTIYRIKSQDAIYNIATEIAQWKDEQFNKILDETYEMRKEICRSNVSFADCTELIQRIRKKLEE